MPIFTLDNPRVPATPRQSAPVATQESRTVAAVGITAVIILIVSATAGVALLSRYVAKFATPDQSRGSITFTGTETVFTNPDYGLTVKLPGTWRLGDSDVKYFCTLVEDGGLSAKPRPIFPMIYTTPDQYADAVDQVFLKRGWTMVSDSEAKINGRDGHIIRFEKNSLARVAEIVVVKKWLVMYELLVVGPNDSKEWPRITDALAESIEVK